MQRANANPFPIFPVNANARSAAPTCSNGNAITEEKTVGKPSTNSTKAIKAAKTAPIRIINDLLFMTSPRLLFYDNIISLKLSFVNNFWHFSFKKSDKDFTLCRRSSSFNSKTVKTLPYFPFSSYDSPSLGLLLPTFRQKEYHPQVKESLPKCENNALICSFSSF